MNIAQPDFPFFYLGKKVLEVDSSSSNALLISVPVRTILPLAYLRLYSRGALFFFCATTLPRPLPCLAPFLTSLKRFLSFFSSCLCECLCLSLFCPDFSCLPSYLNDDLNHALFLCDQLVQSFFNDIKFTWDIRSQSHLSSYPLFHTNAICCPTRKVIPDFSPRVSNHAR